ncbi:MAG: hypothetical protein LQ346_004393 [Caloplaca aetnensis]|nr:MAG: hypothetical protein LQ346_004393 [Caloplaca aetnensis]
MRLTSRLLLATGLLVVRTLAIDASIYVSDLATGASREALSPATTRLLLAQRLGLSQYYGLEDSDDETLRILNSFGGKQKTLLSNDEPWTGPQRNLIIVEGVEQQLQNIIRPEAQEYAFTLSDVPHSSHTLQLINDLARQARGSWEEGWKLCSYSLENGAKVDGGIVWGPSDSNGYCPLHGSAKPQEWNRILSDISNAIPGRTAILRISMPDASSRMEDPAWVKDLSQRLSQLLASDSDRHRHESTIILLPPSTQKRKQISPYGPEVKSLHARGAQSEAPLTAPSAPQPSLPSHHHSTPQILKAPSSGPKPGILPVCQPSLEKLADITGNCSGHGTPHLKHNSTDTACYVCKCKNTVISRGKGKGVKTIEWAGPACSKKDVSMPFWLLAGISIAMVATVSWGIGLLFSIGQEDLPSVIGAGVAGPRAQK